MLRRRSDTEGPNEHFHADSPGVSASGLDVAGPFLDEAAEPEAVEPTAQPMVGTIRYESQELGIALSDFHMVCSPAETTLSWNGIPVTVGGEPLRFELHHVHTWVESSRPIAFWEQGIAADVQAALLVPDSLDSIDDAEAGDAVKALLRDKEVVNFLGQVSPEGIALSEIMWTEPFRVPAEEKEAWSPIEMELGPDPQAR